MSKLHDLQALLSRKQSAKFYAKRLGISELEVKKMIWELQKSKTQHTEETSEIKDEEENSVEQNVEKGTLRITKLSTENPTSPEEIIKLHGIDPKKWKLSQFWSKQKRDKWLVSALFTAISIERDLVSQKNIILDEIKAYIATRPKQAKTHSKAPGKDSLLLISLPDLHFGKLAHKDEVGEDYDIKIASERAKEAVNDLLNRVNIHTIDRILFPVGNDLFNVDNQQSTTTAGTPQDCDTRFHKMVKTTRSVLVEIINQLSYIAPVDVPIVVGNHDATTAFLMGEILEAWYHNDPDVNVQNGAAQRKYYQYHKNGFQFTHGNGENHKDLGLIFATEQPKLWADTKFRFCQLGHFHSAKKINYVSLESHQGFQIEILPSLSGPDAWHSSKGYISNKAAKAFLYHHTKGEIANYTYTVSND